MKKRGNKHNWRFEKDVDPLEVLNNLTVGELYLLVHSHSAIWQAFVRHRGLTYASRRELIERVKRAVHDSQPESGLLLSDCIASIQVPIIEHTGRLLEALDLSQQQEQERKLQADVFALRRFLPFLSPIVLKRREGDSYEIDRVSFVQEKDLESLSNLERNNCFACLEFTSPHISNKKHQSFLVRIVKTRSQQVKLVCRKRHVPVKYEMRARACSIADGVLRFPDDILRILISYVFSREEGKMEPEPPLKVKPSTKRKGITQKEPKEPKGPKEPKEPDIVQHKKRKIEMTTKRKIEPEKKDQVRFFKIIREAPSEKTLLPQNEEDNEEDRDETDEEDESHIEEEDGESDS